MFLLRVLKETLTYEVDQILIVEPDDTSALYIDPNADYCTLITCTPYGINSHRLLVRGHRVPNQPGSSVNVSADAVQYDPLVIAPLVAVPFLVVLLIILLVKKPAKNKKSQG